MSESLRFHGFAPDGSSIEENFRNWFGGSKAVDDGSNPLVLFHGSTGGGITSCNCKPTYFSSSPNVASSYATGESDSESSLEGLVQAFYVRMSNPLIIDACESTWKDIPYSAGVYTSIELVSRATKLGHDGLILLNVEDHLSDEDLLLSDVCVTLGKRAQFKSVLGNNGLYDRDCDDVTDRQSVRLREYLAARSALQMIDGGRLSLNQVRISP